MGALIDAHKAEAIIRIRIIRAGRDAWGEIAKSENFEAWLAIGKALTIGKAHALKASGANAPWGQNYCRAFSAWAKETGFSTMRASDRSYAIALSENLGAITSWRATLSDKQRGRLRSAQANVRRWRIATGQHRQPEDLKLRATMHWRRFLDCLRAMPPAEREPLWHQSLAEMMVRHAPQ